MVLTCEDLPRELAPGLVLRRASSGEELARVVSCHAASFGEDERTAIAANLCQRPGSLPGDVLYVEDVASKEVVSSISLIRETWSYEGIPFPVGEVGIVSTRAPHRRRGLIRAQFEVCHSMAAEAGCLLTVISGIPYFYRQLGYNYVLPMGGGWILPADCVPEPAARSRDGYSTRPAGVEDMPLLRRYYAEMARPFCVSAIMPEEIWLYQDSQPQDSDDRKTTYVVEHHAQPVGYLRMMAREDAHWNQGVRLIEAFLPDEGACRAALGLARDLAVRERKERVIRIEMTADVPLVHLGQALGADQARPYAWLMRVLDPVRWLLTVAPALERRLAASPVAGTSQEVKLNLYTEAYQLTFREGRLERVATLSDASGSDFRCPPTVMPALWFGYKSVGELLDAYPDASCKRESRTLIETLFPKRDSFISTLI